MLRNRLVSFVHPKSMSDDNLMLSVLALTECALDKPYPDDASKEYVGYRHAAAEIKALGGDMLEGYLGTHMQEISRRGLVSGNPTPATEGGDSG